jgi:hypothetical protein
LEVDRKVELQLLVFHLRRDLSIFFLSCQWLVGVIIFL